MELGKEEIGSERLGAAAEIARQLGMTVAAVSRIRVRAREKLRRLLAEMGYQRGLPQKLEFSRLLPGPSPADASYWQFSALELSKLIRVY
jgi:hypothetical protein